MKVILPPITNKQKEILTLLFRFRFLDRKHIQHLLNHKDYKTINVWLKDLTEKQHINRIYEHTFQGHTIPAKYYIALNGIRYFKSNSIYEKRYLQKLYKESQKSEQFMNTCLLIADIYIQLLKNHSTHLTFFTQSDFPSDGVIRDLMPSFGFVIKDKRKETISICELFTEKQPRYFIRSRIQKYIEFFQEEPDTTILFIAPSVMVQNYITRFTQKIIAEESEDLKVIVSTVEEIKMHGIRGNSE